MQRSEEIPTAESFRKTTLLGIIQQHQPDASWNKAEYISSGRDHEIVVLDDTLVYRFPRAESSLQSNLLDEAHLLEYLNRHIDGLQIPQYTYVAEDGAFGAYEFIHGDPLGAEMLNGFPEEDKDAAISQIASFLSQLHAVPLHVAEEYNVKKSNPEETYNALEANVKNFVLHRLSEDEQETTLQYLEDFRATLNDEFESVFRHGDLKEDNVLWDSAEKHIKIIDFGDREYGDPAGEFRWLMQYGQDALDKILDQYQGPIDANLQNRIKLQHIRPAFRSMWVGVERNDEQRFQKGYAMFRKYFYGN